MRANAQKTGMLGVYLTAAELTKLELIVSPTSRNAFGADLLVTDQHCSKAWSVQVKTNGKPASFWLLNARVGEAHSESHIYVFVNINGEARPEYFVVPSKKVAELHHKNISTTGSVWYAIELEKIKNFKEGWKQIFWEGEDMEKKLN